MGSDPSLWTVVVHVRAQPVLSGLRETHGGDWYEAQKRAFKAQVCGFIDSTEGRLDTRQGDSFCPVPGGIKMRWLVPGSGKSGGLRLGITIDQNLRRIEIRYAEIRKNDPPIEVLVKALLG